MACSQLLSVSMAYKTFHDVHCLLVIAIIGLDIEKF